MLPIYFLDLPTIVRDQIYSELLVPPVIEHNDGEASQAAPPIDIFYTNKQIYAEASYIFYSQNLFVLVSTNSDRYLNEEIRGKTPIFSEIKHPSQATHGRFAMTIELLNLGASYAETTSTPRLVISAQALPYFARGPVGESGPHWGGVVTRMVMEESFRYSPLRMSELLFGRFLAAEAIPKFFALRLEGPITESYRHAMTQRCVWCTGHEGAEACQVLASWLSHKINILWRMMLKWDSADYHPIHEKPKLMLRVLDIFWECHTHREREFGHTCAAPGFVFEKVVEVSILLIFTYFLAAACNPDRAAEPHVQALRAAERAIAYLSTKDPPRYPYVAEDQPFADNSLEWINKAKATLSRRASEACVRLGYPTEAAAYREDASIYHSEDTLRGREIHWKLPDYKWAPVLGLEMKVVLWKRDDTRGIRGPAKLQA